MGFSGPCSWSCSPRRVVAFGMVSRVCVLWYRKSRRNASNPDTVFAIASNSKLFTSIATGLFISDGTLKREQGAELSWSTKAKEPFGDLWELRDEEASRGTNIRDMLSHRTGLPGHDVGNIKRNQSVVDKHSSLPSSLSRTPRNLAIQPGTRLAGVSTPTLLNQSFASYAEQHIFEPLEVSSTTYSVAKAEKGLMADGFVQDGQDLKLGSDGVNRPMVPFFLRPENEYDFPRFWWCSFICERLDKMACYASGSRGASFRETNHCPSRSRLTPQQEHPCSQKSRLFRKSVPWCTVLVKLILLSRA
ncbi:hypothetical protein AN958_07693 [Leucoagaricus sp. SymC.cos]|nr:hypothetical protein AN958_07693 [Leucoagaricus sp. SymC.cos]